MDVIVLKECIKGRRVVYKREKDETDYSRIFAGYIYVSLINAVFDMCIVLLLLPGCFELSSYLVFGNDAEDQSGATVFYQLCVV